MRCDWSPPSCSRRVPPAVPLYRTRTVVGAEVEVLVALHPPDARLPLARLVVPRHAAVLALAPGGTACEASKRPEVKKGSGVCVCGGGGVCDRGGGGGAAALVVLLGWDLLPHLTWQSPRTRGARCLPPPQECGPAQQRGFWGACFFRGAAARGGSRPSRGESQAGKAVCLGGGREL
jgi:hypothetical protein